MRVLVDSSVWSIAFRRIRKSKDKSVEKLTDLIESGSTIYLLCIILQEILQGVGQTSQFKKLEAHLEPFPLLHPDKDTYTHAAQLYSNCVQREIQPSTIDCLIAASALEFDCHLLTTDKDFSRISSVAPLKLL